MPEPRNLTAFRDRGCPDPSEEFALLSPGDGSQPDGGVMSDRQELLLDLLDRWRESARQGLPVCAAELCAGCPEMIPALEQQVRFQRGLERKAVPEAPLDLR